MGELKYYPQHADVEKRFADDVAEHVLTVIADYGPHKHLLFRAPGASWFWFELVAWPGALTISGDMGTFTFRRNEDMLSFFEGSGGIDLRYWAEKVQKDGNDPTRQYSIERFTQHVTEHFDEWVRDEEPDALAREIAQLQVDDLLRSGDDEHTAREALADLESVGALGLSDTWEWDLRDFNHRFVWCCLAIRWGIAKYRAEGGV